MLRLGTHESLGNAFLIILKLKNSINNRGLSIFPHNQSSFIFYISTLIFFVMRFEYI